MKINVRHEGATDQEVEQTCVWVVGDDGETVSTSYLKPGEKVGIEIGGTASIQSATGEVEPIAAPEVEPAAEEPATEEPPAPQDPPVPSGDQSASTSGDGANSGESGETPGAPATPSGGEAGGEVAQ